LQGSFHTPCVVQFGSNVQRPAARQSGFKDEKKFFRGTGPLKSWINDVLREATEVSNDIA